MRLGLTLFVTGSTPRSLLAVANVRRLCDEAVPGEYDLEVVDLYEHPERAQPANVLVSPTLVRHTPIPVRLLIGDMSDRDQLMTLVSPP